MKNIGKKVTLLLIGIIIPLVSVFIFKGFQVTQNEEDYYLLNNGWHIEINDTVYEVEAVEKMYDDFYYKIDNYTWVKEDWVEKI